MRNKIDKVINDYLKNIKVHSEDEVRSKLIVPLIEALGYDPTLRGEDFPVYSNHGRRINPTTFADFVVFDDPEFNLHTSFSAENINWVHNHSLLVVEAKKPNEFPDVQGQAQFYTMWLRALAYIVTDGNRIKAWLFNEACSDELIVDADITAEADLSQLLRFDYSSLSESKSKSRDYEKYEIITDASELKLPFEQYQYMRDTLGKDAENLDNLELLSQYLKTCDFILQSGKRYGIHPNALDLLRGVYKAELYIDNDKEPSFEGDLYQSFWEDIDRYQFDCDIFRISFAYCNEQQIFFNIETISESSLIVQQIEEIKRFLVLTTAVQLKVKFIDKQLSVNLNLTKESIELQKNTRAFHLELLNKLTQLREIEENYKLVFTYNKDELSADLFSDVDAVYNGIKMIENCKLPIKRKGLKSFEITEPTILLDGEVPNISNKEIFGFVFHPVRTYALPCKYRVHFFTKKIELSICCEYELRGEG